jgi:hypothetical protein
MIDDKRQDKTEPAGFVVFTDSFMSGWGNAPRRSLYALAFHTSEEADVLWNNGQDRSDMKRGRILHSERDLLRTVKHGDHLSIVDRGTADSWFEPDAFLTARR